MRYFLTEVANGEIVLDLDFRPLVFELLAVIDEMFLFLFQFFHIEQFKSLIELPDGDCILS